MCGIKFREGVEPVRFLENFRKHAVKLGQILLAMIFGYLWDIVSGIIQDGPLQFLVVPHNHRAFYHHLEVGPFPSNLVFSSLLGPFLKNDEDLWRSREVLDLFEIKIL